MGAAQAKLSEQPEIMDLLQVLEQSKLAKECQEVEALVAMKIPSSISPLKEAFHSGKESIYPKLTM